MTKLTGEQRVKQIFGKVDKFPKGYALEHPHIDRTTVVPVIKKPDGKMIRLDRAPRLSIGTENGILVWEVVQIYDTHVLYEPFGKLLRIVDIATLQEGYLLLNKEERDAHIREIQRREGRQMRY